MFASRHRLALVLALLFSGPLAGYAQTLLHGTVVDAETGSPLPGAHLTITGTTSGTITNAEGKFTLTLPSLPATLNVRYIGYVTQQVTLEPKAARVVTIRMEPAVVELGEILVTGEDFADNLMRKVIARKQQGQARLKTYAAEGYTRLVLKHRDAIVFLGETVYDAYWDRANGPREVVRSVRRTSDLHEALPVHDAGYLPNLYADVVPTQGLDLIGPTHPEALRYYRFTLAARRVLDGHTVYDLYVAPRDALHATFIGVISILDEAYAMLGADLRPARHVVFPQPIAGWRVAYRQQFDQFSDSLWLPIDLHAEGLFEMQVDEGHYLRVGLDQVARLTRYRINTSLPEAPYRSDVRVTVDSASVWADPLFTQGRDVIPLTPREAEALERLMDHPVSLRQAFPVERRGGFLAAFVYGRTGVDAPRIDWPQLLGYQFRFRFNRVDGLLASVGQTLDFSPRLQLRWRLGQASGLSRIRYDAGVRYAWSTHGFVEGQYTIDADARQQGSLYSPALASLPALLGGEDYFDYYWNRRFSMGFGYVFPRVRLRLGATREEQEPVEREIERPWPFKHTFRPNPAVDAGTLYTLAASVGLGDGYAMPLPTGLRRAALQVEQGLGNFNFTRFGLSVDARTHTLLPRRPHPNTLDVRLLAGTSRGTLPVQRLGVLDGSLGPFNLLGAFRTLRGRPYDGQHYAGLFWQHDFKTVPFEVLGLWPLVGQGMGIALYGGHGRTWVDADRLSARAFLPHYQDRFHHELGLSFTNVLGTIFRLDVTYRLDEPGFFVGFGLSRSLFEDGR